MTPPAARILLAEDNEILRRAMALALGESGHAVDAVASGDAALARLRDATAEPFDVVITDLRLPRADGLAVLRAARERSPRPAVLIVTAFGSVDAAVEAMRQGAFDFLQKPIDLEHLERQVTAAVEHVRAADSPAPRRTAPVAIVGESAALRAAMELVRRVAPTRATVLLTGETGTGKELVAGLIHSLSPRAERPFVKVNCAALPETLLESELFGHERGAFTGADRARVGRFEQADGGTLFLDEVGDMSPATQAKLLRVLQEQEFHRLGGTHTLRTDVRIVAATNQDLPAAVAAGRFREDLFFRLHVIAIDLPPLREREGDVVPLAMHLLAEAAGELGRTALRFAPEALEKLCAHPWPGNVRELRNAVERAALMAEGEVIGADGLALSPAETAGGVGPEVGEATLAGLERAAVLAALRRAGFVQKDAARRLGVSRRKLNYMIRKLGITHASWRRNSGAPRGDGGGAGDPPLDSPADAR